LIDFRADPNRLDKEERTPLYFAVKNNNSEISSLLLSAGAWVIDEFVNYFSLCVDNEDLLEDLEICKKVNLILYSRSR